MPPLLTLRDASFGYGGRAVVSGVDLTVDAGAFVGIVGHNGSGKSTLLRGVLGLIEPLAGRVERNTRAIGYVPQRETLDALFPLRADEIVHMGAYGRLRGLRRLQAAERDRARTCLARVGLAERASSPFASLSGGQRQRVLLARALMVEPELLVLDEPTSGVDAESQVEIAELLHRLSTEAGTAVLMVSHDVDWVRESADTVRLVSEGRVT